MINRIKSISKRTLAFLLTILMLLSSGVVGTLAANVDLTETKAQNNLYWQGHVYFLAPETWDIVNYPYIQVDITRTTSATSSNYQFYAGRMTRIGESRLFYLKLNADHTSWGQNEFIAFTANDHEYGSGTFNLNGNHYYTTPLDYGVKDSNGYYLFEPSSVANNTTTTNGNAVTGVYNSSRNTAIRANQTVNIYTNGTQSGTGGTVKMSGYYDSGTSSIASSSDTSTTSEKTISYNASQGSKMTLSVASTTSGYKFDGWYDSNDIKLSGNTSYEYNVFNAKTVKAKFVSSGYSYTVTAGEGGTITSATSGTGVTSANIAAKADTGYKFEKWTVTGGTVAEPNSASTTFTITANGANAHATFVPLSKHAVTFLDANGGTISSEEYFDGTKFSEVTKPTAPSKDQDDENTYTFSHWSTTVDGSAVADNYTITDAVTLYPVFTPSKRSYEVTFSGVNGGVTVSKGDTPLDSGALVEYGTVLNLTADEPNKFFTTGVWTANGVEITGNTYEVKGKVELVYTYASKTTYTVAFDLTGDGSGTIEKTYDNDCDWEQTSDSPLTYRVEQGGILGWDINAAENNYISTFNSESFTDNFGHTSVPNYRVTVNGDVEIEVEFTELPEYTVTANSSNTTMGKVQSNGEDFASATVYAGSGINLEAVPVYGYRFTGWTLVTGTVNEMNFNLSSPTINVIPLEETVELTANFEKIPTYTITFTQNLNGTVTDADENTVTSPVTVFENSEYTLNFKAPQGYYISNINGVANSDYTVDTHSITFRNINSNITYDIKYKDIPGYIVTVNNDSTQGTVTVKAKDGSSVNLNAVPYGTVLTVTVANKKGYELKSFKIDDIEQTATTVDVLVNNHITIDVDWDVKQTAEFTLRAPVSQGSAEALKGSDKFLDTNSGDTTFLNKGEVEKGTQLTLTATPGTDKVFNKWELSGDCKLADGYELTNATIVVIVNGESSATATFKAANTYIYIWNNAGYTTPIVKVHNLSGGNDGWYNLSTTVNIGGTYYYKFAIPADAEWINVEDADNKGSTNKQISKDGPLINFGNCYDILQNKWITIDTGEATTLGYVIKSAAGDVAKLEDYGDGIYEGQFTVNVSSISVYPESTTGDKWGLSGEQTENSAQVSSDSNTNIDITLGEKVTEYTVEFKFNPNDGTLTWSTVAKPDTVNIKIYRGINNIGTVDVTNNYWGKSGDSPVEAEVYKDQFVRIETKVSEDYVVLGWVVDGTEFIEPKSEEDVTVFYANYDKFEDGDIVMPVYGHSDSWYEEYPEVKTVRLYFQKDQLYLNDKGKADLWGDWVAAYTWYGNNDSPSQFGAWPGQVFIPDGTGTYYADVELTDASGSAINGITFNNYKKNHANGTYNTPVDGLNVQTYDYNDFITLLNKEYKTITYVLKEQNTTDGDSNLAKGITKYTNTANDFSKFKTHPQVYYDISHITMDIGRNEITSPTREEIAADIKAGTTKPALYIVREGMQVNGRNNFSVLCHFYDSNKNYLNSCFSHELHDTAALNRMVNGDITSDTYKGKPVVVYYEGYTDRASSKTNARLDGEWFGVAADKKVKVDVVMTLKNEDGTYSELQTEADYGSVSIKNNSTSTEVVINSNVDIQANVYGAHKFVGWFNTELQADGTLKVGSTQISTDNIHTLTNISKKATYVAVFEPLGEGTILINHKTYVGSAGEANSPAAHSKDADAYSIRHIKVEWVDKNNNNSVIDSKAALEAKNSLIVPVTENERLKITITTDLVESVDWLYAWYVDSADASGKNIFEEVGMDREFTKDDAGDSQSFYFYYDVKTAEVTSRAVVSETIDVYSDIVHTDMNVQLIYRYYNRYGDPKNYVVNYTLKGEERVNNYPSPDTVEEYAPYVDDLFKNVKWVIKEKIDGAGSTFILEAEYTDQFVVDFWFDGEKKYSVTDKFNTVVEVNAADFGVDNNNGFWYKETDKDTFSYDVGKDIILGYGRYYGLRIAENATICYQTLEEDETLLSKFGYQVVLDQAVYGREQASDGSTALDKIFIDYLSTLHLPYFSGDDVPGKTDGSKFEDELNYNTPVTLKHFMEKTGYTVDYGVVLEMINTASVDKDTALGDNTQTEAQKEKMIECIVNGKSALDSNSEYFYAPYSAVKDDNLTNKNRFLKTFTSGTSPADRAKVYNVYAYLVIKDAAGNVITDDNNDQMIFLSNQQTLNVDEYLTNINKSEIIERTDS